MHKILSPDPCYPPVLTLVAKGNRELGHLLCDQSTCRSCFVAWFRFEDEKTRLLSLKIDGQQSLTSNLQPFK